MFLARFELKPGSAPPCVLLHGFLGTSSDWQAVAEHLPHRCIAVDLPGHGQSPFTPHFCKALLETTKDLPSFHLVGYSMGGRLALQFREAYPERVTSLTLLSTHLGLFTEEERTARLQRDQEIAQEILQKPFDEFLRHWYDQSLFRTLVMKMDIRRLRREQNREGLAQALLAFSLGRQQRYAPNACCLIGEHDEAYRRHYCNVPHILIPNAGHAIHLENSKQGAHEISLATSR
ncbi:MAG: alpha/beta fold hydrolase [Verrucomicrobiota bacterium]|nr:alpha/beta fold hydrolase [Verrucomicrobiota bacterium]